MVGLILFLSLVILVVIMIHRRSTLEEHERLSRQISELPPSPEGTERILEAVEGARMQISSTGDELRAESRNNRSLYERLIAALMKVVTPKEPRK